MMAAARRLPVVVVLGATGAGKSKLAIELGRHFAGEIINADSMQLYQGLDIITNKVTAEEQRQCPHHLLSVLHPLSANNTVTHFRDLALPIIDRLLNDRKLPIIVGGTNYYIEALLWNFLIDRQTVELSNGTNKTSRATDTVSGRPHETSLVQAVSSTVDTVSEEGDGSPHQKPESSREASQGLQQQMQDGELNKVSSQSHSLDCVSEQRKVGSSSSSDSSGDESDGQGSSPSKSGSTARREKEGRYADYDSLHLHSLLQEVDPQSARRLHPKNRRKVVRALQVYDSYGVPMSSIHQAQHASGHSPGLSGELRYPHCCVLWVQSEQTVLNERLDGRVDEMLRQGLVSELHQLHTQYLDSVHARRGEPDYTLGIFQSIGFKEFHDYLLMPTDQRDTPEGRRLLDKGIEALKLATRQYARKQLKWIKNRFLNRPGPHVPDVYGLDSTDPSLWNERVLQPAISIVSTVIQGEEPDIKPLTREDKATVHEHNVCEVCQGRVFVTALDWKEHLRSRKHKKMVERQKRHAKTELGQADS